MMPGTDPHPRRIFEAFVEMLVGFGMIQPGRLARSSGVIPVSGLRKSLVLGSVSLGGVIFCGDAAGFTHPITGAGVPQAVLSGQLAGVSAATAVKTGDWKHLHNYEAEMRGRYGGTLRHAMAKRTLMMSRWQDADFAATCKQTWIAFKQYRKRVR
jgi:flavin-dependent dehydrogenase